MKSLPSILAATSIAWLASCASAPAADLFSDTPAPAALAPLPQAPAQEDQDPVASVWKDPCFKQRVQQSIALKSEIEPSMTAEERESLAEVVELISAEDNEGALRQLDGLVGLQSSAQFDFMRGYVLYFMEDMEGSAAAFEMAVTKFPNFLRAWQLYGQVLLQQEDYQGALLALSQAIQVGGANSDLYGALGYVYSQLGDFLSAESCYRMATVLDPVTAQWKEALAMTFYQQGHFEQLVSYTGTLIAAQPDSAKLWDMQAKGYIRLDQPLRAAENYEMMEMMGLADFTSMATLADIYVNEKLFDVALATYRRALQWEEGDVAAARPLAAAGVMVANSSYDEGLALLQAIESRFAEELDEVQQERVWKLRALTAELTGDGEQQIAALEEILALNPLDGQALLKLGRVFFDLERYQEAELQFERAAQLEVYAARAKLGQAQALVGQDKFGEAVSLLQESLALEDRDPVRSYLKQIESLAAGS